MRKSTIGYCYFNPRPRKEGDGEHRNINCGGTISIHALAKRATKIAVRIVCHTGFQSTPSQRGRPTPVTVMSVAFSFQSTPSQRGRQQYSKQWENRHLFQSTPSQRGRLGLSSFIKLSKKFQSTPSQRGRPSHLQTVFLPLLFQSTPSQRGRPRSELRYFPM